MALYSKGHFQFKWNDEILYSALCSFVFLLYFWNVKMATFCTQTLLMVFFFFMYCIVGTFQKDTFANCKVTIFSRNCDYMYNIETNICFQIWFGLLLLSWFIFPWEMA